MNFAINTVLFPPDKLERAIHFAKELGVKLEILPFWHEDSFCRFMDGHMADLQGLVSSFHEPFYRCEHTAPKGTPAHQEAVDTCRKTYEYAAKLGAKQIVFHHNNCEITPENRLEKIKYATENLQELNEIAAEYGLIQVIENAGAYDKNNVLFGQEDFLALFTQIENPCLLDLGHAHCNGWDLAQVISKLGKRICGYHVHDNNGREDSHLPLGAGTFALAPFLELYRTYTPEASLIFEYAPETADMALIKDHMELFS